MLARHPRMTEAIEVFKKRHPELLEHIAPADGKFKGYADRRLLSVCNKQKVEQILSYMLDENEFFGPYGIRSLSRYHLDHPFVFNLSGHEYKVQNWRTGYRISSSAMLMAKGRSMVERRSFRKIRTGRTTSCSTSTFTVTMAQGLVRAIRPAGRARSHVHLIYLHG